MAVPSPLRPVEAVSLDALRLDLRRAASLPAEVRQAIVLTCSAIIAACAAGGAGDPVDGAPAGPRRTGS
jgi:hypothetical protein